MDFRTKLLDSREKTEQHTDVQTVPNQDILMFSFQVSYFSGPGGGGHLGKNLC